MFSTRVLAIGPEILNNHNISYLCFVLIFMITALLIKGLPLKTIYPETKQDSYAVFSTTIYNLFLAAAHTSRMARWETLHRYPLSLVSTTPIMTMTTTNGLAGGTKPGATTLTIRMITIWAEDIKGLQRGIHLSNIKQPPN